MKAISSMLVISFLRHIRGGVAYFNATKTHEDKIFVLSNIFQMSSKSNERCFPVPDVAT